MPLNKRNTKNFHRRLYAGQLQRVVLKKRSDGQQAGTVTSHVLFQCRRGMITRTGEPLYDSDLGGDTTCSHQVRWLIPKSELKRVGVEYINSLDRIVDPVEGFTYQPESTTSVEHKLFGNFIGVNCLKVENA